MRIRQSFLRTMLCLSALVAVAGFPPPGQHPLCTMPVDERDCALFCKKEECNSCCGRGPWMNPAPCLAWCAMLGPPFK